MSELRDSTLNATQTVQLSADALASIAQHAAASADGRETGGILLGYDANELGATLVMEAGDPGPNAERRRDFFQRDLAHAQRLADDAFSRSCSRWIGEWHTHPNGVLVPSRRDMRTYRSFLRDLGLDFGTFLALIVGPDGDDWTRPRAVAWRIEPRRVLPAILLPTRERLPLTIESPSSTDPEDEPA